MSAKTGEGLPRLIDALGHILGASAETRDAPLVTNVRHASLLEQSRQAIARAHQALTVEQSTSEEFVLSDLQDAAIRLQEITGRRTTDELLRHIFDRFCIGK